MACRKSARTCCLRSTTMQTTTLRPFSLLNRLSSTSSWRTEMQTKRSIWNTSQLSFRTIQGQQSRERFSCLRCHQRMTMKQLESDVNRFNSISKANSSKQPLKINYLIIIEKWTLIESLASLSPSRPPTQGWGSREVKSSCQRPTKPGRWLLLQT